LKRLLLMFPYIIYILALGESLAIGILNPDKVIRAPSDIYCIISTTIPGKISGIIVIATQIVTIVFEGRIAIFLHANWRSCRRSETPGSMSLTMMIRVAIFTFFGLVTIAASLVLLSHTDSIIPNVFIAIMPMAAFSVFGTQLDIVRVWMFWQENPRPASKVSAHSPSDSTFKDIQQV